MCCILLQDNLRGQSLPDGGERSYVMSKTLLLMATTRELARRLEGTGVDVVAGERQGTAWVQHSRRYTCRSGFRAVKSKHPFSGQVMAYPLAKAVPDTAS